MRITIPAHLEAFVKEKVAEGRYRNTDEAVGDALRLLKDRDKQEFKALRALLKERAKEAKAGKSVAFDAKVRDGVRQRGMTRLASVTKARG